MTISKILTFTLLFLFFGIPTEDAKYFTLVLGRPNMVSTFLLDSNFLAKNLLIEEEVVEKTV